MNRRSCPRFWKPETPSIQHLWGVGPWKPLLPEAQATGRLWEAKSRCKGLAAESREGVAQGNPDSNLNDETKVCTCARMCVGALKMFVFVNNFYYSYVP